MTQNIIARKSKETENYAVYDSPEPDSVDEEFTPALAGMYVSFHAFGTEAPEVIGVRLGEDEAMELSAQKTTTNTQSFERGDAIVGMYVAHRLYDEQVPEEMFVSIDASASLEDWEQAVEATEDEFGVMEGSVDDLVIEGADTSSDDTDDDSDEAEAENEGDEEDLSEDEEELAALVEEAA